MEGDERSKIPEHLQINSSPGKAGFTGIQVIEEVRVREHNQFVIRTSCNNGLKKRVKSIDGIDVTGKYREFDISKVLIEKILRTFFTIHLSKSGVDLRYIQEMLGHKSSKITEIYTDVSKTSIGSRKSPIDTILNERKI